jgi:hypothetical protein
MQLHRLLVESTQTMLSCKLNTFSRSQGHEGLCKLKNPTTSSGIKPATFRFVATRFKFQRRKAK